MKIWDLCIQRPIFTAMLVSAPIVLGLASYPRLGVELFPNVDLPLVTVTTTLRGASVEEMETGVTKPIEEIVNTVSGIEQLRSTTKEGISQLTIEFELEKNGAVAAQEVDAKVRTILSQLPEGTDAPIIDKFALDAAPVLTVAVSGRRDAREITEIARRRIKEDLESLPGVGAVILVGGRQRAIQISIDTDRLLKYEQLTIEDVRQALVRENQEQPGGRIDQGPRELVLRTMGRVREPADFAELIVANRHGQPIRIKDIGTVSDSFEEPRGLSRLWTADPAELADARGAGRPGDLAVSLIVQKQSGTNTVAVVERVKHRLEEIRAILPDDIDVQIIRDQSRFIENSIHEVQTHMLLAAVLVSLTILLFMRDWRTTLIATLSIPTSMIATFAFMDAMGFTLNNITMLGLILAIGIVVDDAVVVHENIFRHMEEYGLGAREAAASATQEIALAVVATTFSLLVIFIPVVFMGGRVGRFFSSFGYVVAFSILMSMFISFTMTPMLCSRFLKAEDAAHSSKSGFVWRAVEGFYMLCLRFSLRHRWLVVLVTVGVLASTPSLMRIVGKDFVPRDDTSEFEVAVTLPEGCSLERADEVLSEVESRLRDLRAVRKTLITIGDTTGRTVRGQGEVTRASIYCRLSDLREREYSQFDVMADARQILLSGQGEGHVRLALERLRRRFGVEIDTEQPRTPYRETIQRAATQRGRHKKQTGGHGQFGDVVIEIRPLPRGSGFVFQQRISGGVVPKQWIPAVEQGVRDGLVRGPLGFPVTDLEVTLIDGSSHSVDSSEMAFRMAGRLAIEEGLKACGSVLLEPIEKLVVYSPSPSASNVTSALTARRGQILGLAPREDWRGWERIEAYLPQSERQQLIAELRGLTQGLGAFEADFDHMAELTGRLAQEASQAVRAGAPAAI